MKAASAATIARGATYRGKPCKAGHTLRYRRDNSCVECAKAAAKRNQGRP